MKNHWTAVLLALPALAACSGTDMPTAPTPIAVRVERQDRPFNGRCETSLTVIPPLPGDTPNILRLHIEYRCRLSRLGRTTATADQVVTFTGPTSAIASNSTTYTAANGDRLFATWTGTATSTGPDVTFSGPERYAGGTGRFADARGASWIAGTASFATNRGQFSLEGKLIY